MSEIAPAFGRGLRHHWSFAPGTIYLNHGAFGAVPRVVAVAQQAWRDRAEAQPTQFHAEVLPEALREALARLGGFLGARPGGLAFVENATSGINAILRSLPWRAGDAIVLTDQVYPAVRNLVHWLAQRHGLRVLEACLPMPLDDPRDAVRACLAAAGPGTRLAIVDHVVSGTGVVLPVREIAAALRARGVPVLVDAAHTAGMLDLDLDAIGAEWVVGDLHKWLFAPRGCAFLHASEAVARDLQPATISGLAGMGFPGAFSWTGTRDYSPFLSVPAALDFVEWLGVAGYRRAIRDLAWRGAGLLARRWGADLPAGPESLAAMVAVPLPDRGMAAADGEAAGRAWTARLWEHHRIAVPVGSVGGRLWARISAQVYNDLSDFAALADAVAGASP